MVKRLLQHVEWPGVTIFFGFMALAAALRRDFDWWAVGAIAVVGLVLALLSAHNAYMQKSTTLADKYEERFFDKMKKQRQAAALFLLGENSNGDELEDVLDFFESPIADRVDKGSIDEKQVYDLFYHWLRLYLQASQKFVVDYRKEEPAAWTCLQRLYEATSRLEKKALQRELGRVVTDSELVLSQEKLSRYLRQEANLKAD